MVLSSSSSASIILVLWLSVSSPVAHTDESPSLVASPFSPVFLERLLRLPSVNDDPWMAGFILGGFLMINVLTYAKTNRIHLKWVRHFKNNAFGILFLLNKPYLMLHFQWAMKTACLAALRDGAFLDVHLQIRLGIVAFGTQNVFTYEAIQKILQFVSLMRSIHNETFMLFSQMQKN